MNQAYLRGKLRYDPSIGLFHWRHSGKLAGCTRKDGYVVIRIDRVLYLAHRLAWLYCTGDWPTQILDHINQNPSDNRLENLREVTHSQNHANIKPQVNTTTGHVGVSWHSGTRKWRARFAGTHLGVFSTKEEAAQAVSSFRQNHMAN